MTQKLFIGINIPSKAKKRLVSAVEKWQDLPIKWTREDKLHLTMLFLGYQDEDLIPEICEKVRVVCENEDIFDVEFDSIELAPSKETPQMIWLLGKPDKNLLRVYEKLEKELGLYTVPKKSFRPHITLGRIRKFKWEVLDEQPKICEKFQLIVTADSIDVMSGNFEQGENEHTILDSCPLK
jgi:RNA 2',3'-cyclic 3'-phosphodiesterase